MGRDMGHGRDYSEDVAREVDGAVRSLIEQAHDEAWTVLNDNRVVLDRLASELMEKETLDHIQLAAIFADVQKLTPREQWLSSTGRPVSDQPPISLPVSQQVDAAVDVDSDEPGAEGASGA